MTAEQPEPAAIPPRREIEANLLDWIIVAAGVIALTAALFPFYTYTIPLPGDSTGSLSAWRGGLAPLAVVLAVGAAIVLAVELTVMRLAFRVRTVVLAAFAFASLLLLLALFVMPGDTSSFEALGTKLEKGHAGGYWVCLLAVLAGTVLAAKRFVDAGGRLTTGS